MYTHADTSVVGRHAFIVERHDYFVNFSGYDSTKGSVQDLRVVNSAITVDNVDTGKIQVVIINQAVHISTMVNNLICPMQMRMHGTVVNYTTKFIFRDPSDDDQCVLLKN